MCEIGVGIFFEETPVSERLVFFQTFRLQYVIAQKMRLFSDMIVFHVHGDRQIT